MSQDVLGRRLGVSSKQVQQYESGSSRISASMLVKAARALGVNPTIMLTDEGETENGRPAVLKIIADMHAFDELIEAFTRITSPRLRRAVLQLCRSLGSSADDR